MGDNTQMCETIATFGIAGNNIHN